MDIAAYFEFVKQHNYIYSLSIFVVFFALSELLVWVSEKIILRITKKTKTDLDDVIVKKINAPISWILIFVGIRLALLPLGIPENVLGIIENLIQSCIIIVITYIVVAVFDILIDKWGMAVAAKTKSTFDDQLVPIFHRFSRIFISVVGLLFILPVWGIQIGPLLASLGIAGIAIAFALQSTLGNIFGGMSIILDKSVKVGDKIKLDADTMGTVEDVGLRSTKIRTWDNEMITVPNGKLADSKILNFMQPDPSVKVTIDFGVEYGSDPNKVREIVSGVIKKIPNVIRQNETKVLMAEMGDFALKFRAMFWVNNFDTKFDTKCLATEEIYNVLRSNGIVIPFPTRTIHMKKE
ncbi:MAG TPA: mechanosensitive ion channel family protein [Candidatus Nanoarchaeia archaeon]|nr:mechanosensitive ion channel family protein [Candidatus Nanoarchaeia archaeon]